MDDTPTLHPEVGRTRDAGWQIGVSRTLGHPIEPVWDLLVSPAGLAIWLGEGVGSVDEVGRAYETDDGTVGEVRSFHPYDRVRLTWRPRDWDHESIVQVALSRAEPDRTKLVLHQERLADADERARQRIHWRAVMEAVVAELA
ncbi:SRPBCC family protein [Nocardioides pacificus]